LSTVPDTDGIVGGYFNLIWSKPQDRQTLKDSVYLLNSQTCTTPAEKDYDCINWSLGFRTPVVQGVSDTITALEDLFRQYGFERLRDSSQKELATIVVFLAKNDDGIFPCHCHVKRNVVVGGVTKTLWTSKQGKSPLLIGYPQPRNLMDYYGMHFNLIETPLVFKRST